MAYDERLAGRVREIFGPESAEERRMFGGLAFLVRGHICCGIVGKDSMARVGPDRHAEALSRPHARPMDFTGRPMTGMVFVGAEGCPRPASLQGCVEDRLAHIRSLRPKVPRRRRAPRS